MSTFYVPRVFLSTLPGLLYNHHDHKVDTINYLLKHRNLK